jgi:hypothetical protein
MKKITLPALALLLLTVFSSCYYLGGKRVKGNGNITTETRNVSAFDRVEVSGAVELYVSGGETQPVKIETDENLLKYIEVEQHGNTLDIHTRRGYNLRPTHKVIVRVSSPNYSQISVSGASNIIGQNKIIARDRLEMHVSGAGDINADVDAPELKSSISGSGNVNLMGQVRDLELDISGAGDAKCYDMKAENTKVQISGAGSAEVYASVSLDAHVSGAGSVSYKGGATKVSQQVSGAGSVKKVD